MPSGENLTKYHWKKGQSGNPGGRPSRPETLEKRKVLQNVRELCKENSVAAIRALLDVMNSQTAPPSSRVAAANSVLDRGWGKPTMEINTTITSYDSMSEADLVGYITGQVIEGEVIQALIDAEKEQEELLDDGIEEDPDNDTDA
jgi:hypothetical protein